MVILLFIDNLINTQIIRDLNLSYLGKSTIEQYFLKMSDDKNDIHTKLMSRYRGVSEWW